MEAFLPPAAPCGPRPFHGRWLSRTAPRPHPHRAARPRFPTASLPDVVIIGGGLAGLSTARELSQRGASVRVLTTLSRPPAGLAAAGMLAPAAELLPAPLRKLSDHSLELYPSFIRALQPHAPQADLRYVSLPDFLCPHLHASDVRDSQHALLSGDQARLLEPALSDRVLSAERLRGQAHVDNRAVMAALRAACDSLGVVTDADALVRRLVVAPGGGVLDGVLLHDGDLVRGGHYLLAGGAWSGGLLPGLPVRPIKGQMLSLRPPSGEQLVGRLQHVLHSKKVYVVPKKDGEEFFVGATMEEGTFDLANTAGGLASLLNSAVELVPDFARYEVAETWSGVRPATPDLMPVLGMSEMDNLSIATGYYRNGFLIAPAAAKIAAATALGETDRLPAELREIAASFSIERFLGAHGQEVNRATAKTKPSQTISSHNRSDVEGDLSSPTSHTPAHQEQDDLSIDEATGVMVWRVLPDGSREPIRPAEPFIAAMTNSQTKQNEVASQAPAPAPPQAPATDEIEPQFSYSKEVESPGSISGENDAYEDVMQHRGEDEERVMRDALAANRAFGREKSSLETDGVPLSLSEEEVKRFDAALEQGLEDFRKLDQTFDENHPSVVATRAEMLRSSEEPLEELQIVNGVPNARFDSQVGSDPNSSGSSGYF